MRHPPDWLEGGGVVCLARDEMPVDVRQLVAEEFVVDLCGPIGLRERLGDQGDVFHQLYPFCRRQMKEFCRVALKDDNGPAGEELIVMQVDLRDAEIRDEMIGSGPGLCAGLAGRIGHGSRSIAKF